MIPALSAAGLIAILVVSMGLTGCEHILRNPDMGAGVATAGPYPGSGNGANYRHPTTGDLQYCRKPLVVGALSASLDLTDYALCKTELEKKGYVRAD